ncbi:aminotransferase class I/II-fold pyridoxal phosphate-dependent enzyme [Solirubrobacter ginsenosidimutans]|uniref:Aminotransferase class I/II-fold pyridoxal phosphate-dependent enzyme n=1 Tax=Solirubrobacter ginsenosidimutans TaxID=490573 RepID=A0A9X3S2Y0_9ACTN|nr:aminotransferase class I/II-fold pyridoxal phosphate-dependent enzyme [Solirubrobacter ginsenosidimutans]MDA0165075.1 aminotransferase class I/II-fold pyridoxal phosphate-dependent enzyme [Solirubrobacter ginsenosidimutans]
MSVRLSPVLAGLGTYPFVRLEQARARLRAAGVDIIDFGMGEPREETPAFIREALAAAITPLAPYPSAVGLPELRGAIAGWASRRFGVDLDPDTEVIPTLGSKEAVFALANVFAGDVVAVPTPSYPVYDRGALFAGKAVLELPLKESNGWLPDLDTVDWSGVGVLWLNYPNNPTGARAPLEFYEHAAALAREHGFVLASDEAYSELYFEGDPPISALQIADRSHLAVFNTLSKRSSMPGYRSGFVAGDPDIVAALKKYRPNVGVAPLEFVQRAAIAAWTDEAHVEAVRERYRAKREALLPTLEALGLRNAGGDATFFLWLDAGPDAEALAARWLEAGVVVAPGSFFGAPGYLRVALVPPPEACARAAEIIRGLG